jgi:hypothetical protein
MAKKVNEIEANVGIIGKLLLAHLKSQEKLHDEMRALGVRPDGTPAILGAGDGGARTSIAELD